MAVNVSNSISPDPSVRRARGRRIGTLRPPNTTDVSVVPPRVASRPGSLAWIGPHNTVRSDSIISPSTASPVGHRQGQQALTGHLGDISQHQLHLIRQPSGGGPPPSLQQHLGQSPAFDTDGSSRGEWVYPGRGYEFAATRIPD